MSGKLYRISTRGYIADVQHVLNGFIELQRKPKKTKTPDPVSVAITQLHSQGFPLLPLNQKSATILVHTLIKYEVSTFLAYGTPELDEQTIAECLFGEVIELSTEVRLVIEAILALETIDDLIVDISLQLSNFLQSNTWNIVDVLDFDTNLSIVVSEDIRIREWKQMKGVLEQCDSVLELDLTPVISYLKNTFNRLFGKVTLMHMGRAIVIGAGDAMDFRQLILDHLCLRFGFLRKTGQIGPATNISHNRLEQWFNAISPDLIGQASVDPDLLNGRIGSNHIYRYFTGLTSGQASGKDIDQSILAQAVKDPVHQGRIIKEYINSVLETYGVIHRLNRLDDTITYHVDISDRNRLVVTMEDVMEGSILTDEQRLKELAESFIRGDYLPTKEREEAERYLQENHF